MSTITSPPRRARTPPPSPQMPVVSPGEQRIVIRDVSWHLYDVLSDAIGEGQHVYLAYDGKDLEIMTTGTSMSDYKELFGRLVKRRDVRAARSTAAAAARPRGSAPRSSGDWKPTSATSSHREAGGRPGASGPQVQRHRRLSQPRPGDRDRHLAVPRSTGQPSTPR